MLAEVLGSQTPAVRTKAVVVFKFFRGENVTTPKTAGANAKVLVQR